MSLLVPEGIPAPGVYHSNNGAIYLGGERLFRVSSAFLRIMQGSAMYMEIGSKFGIPYPTLRTVAGNISKAFTNLYDMFLTIGLPVDFSKNFIPGAIYDSSGKFGDINKIIEDVITALESGKAHSKFSTGLPDGRPANSYPIKTTAEFHINEDKVASTTKDFTTSNILTSNDNYTHIIKVDGVLINLNSLALGTGAEIVTSGPIDFIGENYDFSLVE